MAENKLAILYREIPKLPAPFCIHVPLSSALYNRSYICETECEAILEIYDEKSGAPISLLDSLRSRERGDLVQVVGIGKKARFGRILPLVQLQQVGNPLSLYDGETRVDSQGRHVLVGYDKDPA